MDAMHARTRNQRLVCLLLVGAALATVACVPNPAAPRQSATGGGIPSPSAATPEPTPAGPTPIPSFIRPTPTPLPTFLVYVVAPGDSLEGIGDRFGTSGRSIAWWNRFTYPSLDPLSDDYEPDRIVVGWTLRLVPGLEYDAEDFGEPSDPPTSGPTGEPTTGP
jgi:hypothetical protein